jgi:hypothetical protein
MEILIGMAARTVPESHDTSGHLTIPGAVLISRFTMENRIERSALSGAGRANPGPTPAYVQPGRADAASRIDTISIPTPLDGWRRAS